MERRIRLVITSLVLTAVTASSCSSTRSDLSEVLPAGVSEDVRRDVSEFQRTIVEDGTVDRSEYERAVLATIGCLEDSGVWVSDPAYDPSTEVYSFDFGGAENDQEAELMEATYDRCYKQYQDLVDEVWAIQHAPTQQEEQAFYGRILRCVAELGYDIDTDPTTDNLNRAIVLTGDDYNLCFSQAQRQR